MTLVDAVRGSETWKRACAAEALLLEAPFALSTAAGERREGATIVEGVIDLAFREDGDWVIVDYKTDVVEDDTALAGRRQQYRDQVDAYARYFAQITGATVKERQILWVGKGIEAEVW